MSDVVSLVDLGQEDRIFDFNPGFLTQQHFLRPKVRGGAALFLARAGDPWQPYRLFWHILFCPGFDRSHELVVTSPVVPTSLSEKAAPDSWENLPIFIMNSKRRNTRMQHYHFSVLFYLRP